MIRGVGLAIVAFGAAAVSVAACNSGSGSSDLSPAVKARWNEYCALRDTYISECNPSGRVCQDTTCVARVVEEQPLVDYIDCQLAKSCDLFFNDDECAASAGTSDPERDAFLGRCNAKVGECGLGLSVCAVGMPLIRKSWMHAYDACLARACPDLEACLVAVDLPDCI